MTTQRPIHRFQCTECEARETTVEYDGVVVKPIRCRVCGRPTMVESTS